MNVTLLWDDTRREHAEKPELVGVFRSDVAALRYKQKIEPDAGPQDFFITISPVVG